MNKTKTERSERRQGVDRERERSWGNTGMWMRSSCGWYLAEWLERLTANAKDHNSPGFDPSILRHIGIWGAAKTSSAWMKYEYITNNKKIKKLPEQGPSVRCLLNIQYYKMYISHMLHVQSQFQYIFNSVWTERRALVLINYMIWERAYTLYTSRFRLYRKWINNNYNESLSVLHFPDLPTWKTFF